MENQRIDEIVITLSPSSIYRYETCEAWFVYQYLLPSIAMDRSEAITDFGKRFHEAAERDFASGEIDISFAHEHDRIVSLAQSLAEDVKNRYYFDLPSVKEEELSICVESDRNILRGFPDRVCLADDGWTIIVDYKTSFFPNPSRDLKQVLMYAYMLVALGRADSSKTKVIIDYVRCDKNPLYEYVVTDEMLRSTENHLKSVFRRVRNTLQKIEQKVQMSKFVHSPGECSFCPMVGRCTAYQIMINPVPQPQSDEYVPTEALIQELFAREEAWKVNEERARVIRETLLSRMEHDLEETVDGRQQKVRDIIERYFTIQHRPTYSYPTEAVLSRIVPKRLAKAMKGIPFTSQVDMQVVERAVMDVLLEALPKYLKQSEIPKDFVDKVQDLKITKYNKPFLKAKL